MATLANIFNNFVGARALERETTDSRARCDEFRLRAMPNEEIFFYVKRIDNSRVVRAADPRDRAANLKVLGGAGFAGLALIALLLPSAWTYMAGYELGQLRKENQRLITEQARLELDEARLVSARNLQELADDFVVPAADQTQYLSAPDSSLALNQRR
jgi:hypothetical protein